MKTVICLITAVVLTGVADAQQLFVGLETGTVPALPTRSTDLAGFPDVTYKNHFKLDVSGAAAAPDGTLYLCNGAFTTKLYASAPGFGAPVQIATLSIDIHGMAYGSDALYGYSNFAATKGIYEIDTVTGDCTLALDIYTGTGFRFFALGYNPVDDLFYGYTEYGDSGLYSINLDTGDMIKIVDTIPASNGQGRGLAVGNNTVFLTATRGDDDIPFFAYDLSQGIGGDWVGFTNPYPDQHATGAAAWIPDPCPADVTGDDTVDVLDLLELLSQWGTPGTADITGDGVVDVLDLLELLGAWGPC